jgi:hypothetical protein
MTVSQQRLFSMALDYAEGANKTKLEAAKEKLAVLEGCVDKTTAAAFGYLLAMEEKPEEGPTIYDRVHAVVENTFWKELDKEEACDLIFGLIYHWLNDEFSNNGYNEYVLSFLKEQFAPLLSPGNLEQ